MSLAQFFDLVFDTTQFFYSVGIIISLNCYICIKSMMK